MFNVIRIPTKFIKPINRLSKVDRAELFDLLLNIGNGERIEVPDNSMGDLLSLIYGEWMNMESRNGIKPKESLIVNTSEGVGTETPSESLHRVEESRVKESRVDVQKEYGNFIQENIGKENITALILDTFIKLGFKPSENLDKFREWVKTRIIEVYTFSYKEFEIVVMKFYDYWIQEDEKTRKSKNWKATFNNSFDLKSLKLK